MRIPTPARADATPTDGDLEPHPLPRPAAPAVVAADVETLVRQTVPLVHHIVREMTSRLPGHVDGSDLVSAGLVALVQAAKSWDAERGVPFPRYAAIRIRGALTDELRGMDWASRAVRGRGRAIEQARQRLTSDLGRAPTPEEVATATGLSAAAITDSDADLSRASVLSLHSEAAGEGVAALADDREGPEQLLVKREALGYLQDAIEELPERLRMVVRGYFFEQRPMAELAAELGVTESRISQLRAEAVVLLRAGLAPALEMTPAEQPVPVGPRVLAARQAYVSAVASRSTLAARLAHTSPHAESRRMVTGGAA